MRDIINRELDNLIISFFNNESSEDVVLKTLNEIVYHNNNFKPFIYELFFIRALKLKKVPKNKYFLGELFKISDVDDFLLPETFGDSGTRINVLKVLKLLKTLKVYEDYLICSDDEAHTYFKDGINNARYIEANKIKPDVVVFNCLQSELEENF